MQDLGTLIQEYPHKKMSIIGYILGGIAALMGILMVVFGIQGLITSSSQTADAIVATVAGVIFFLPGLGVILASIKKAKENKVFTVYSKGLYIKSAAGEQVLTWDEFTSILFKNVIIRTKATVTSRAYYYYFVKKDKSLLEFNSVYNTGVDENTGAKLAEISGLKLIPTK